MEGFDENRCMELNHPASQMEFSSWLAWFSLRSWPKFGFLALFLHIDCAAVITTYMASSLGSLKQCQFTPEHKRSVPVPEPSICPARRRSLSLNQINDDPKPNTNPSTGQTEFSLLWDKLGNLEDRVNENRTGLIGRINKWAVIVGLVATVLSITGGALTISSAVKALNPKPNTKVIPEKVGKVDRGFDLQDKRVTYTVNCILENSGDKDDVITVNASIGLPGIRKDLVDLIASDLQVNDRQTPSRLLPRPFILPKGASIELTCSMLFAYSEESSEAFQKDSPKRLTVTFD